MEIFDSKSAEALSGVGKGAEVEAIDDVVTFARERLGFDPDAKQECCAAGGEGS